jgi:hypothetical protein
MVRQQAMGTAVRVVAMRDGLVDLSTSLDGNLHWEALDIRRAIISPSPERAAEIWDGRNGFQRMASLRTQAQAVARDHGFLGEVMIFHPWRDAGTWVFDRPGPHFHVIGPAAWLSPGDGADGWVFKASPVRLELGGVYDRLAYDLTHVGVVPRRPVIIYSGMLHHRHRMIMTPEARARVKAILGNRTHVCPVCSSTNTRTYIPTMDELESWGIVRPLERKQRSEILQHRFRCDDCGHVETEPIPPVRPAAVQPINPFRMKKRG